MKGEGCALSSPAASGILNELTALPKWLRVDLAYKPFFMPESFDTEGMSGAMSTHMGQAEYLRGAILQQQRPEWWENLTQVPWTIEELREKLK